MVKEGYSVSDIYQGGYSSFKAPLIGYPDLHMPAGQFSLATDPRTSDILKEVSDKLKTGVKQIEVSQIEQKIFDAIPLQHLKEVNRLSKLTGVDISVHAPLVEPSGINPEKGYSEFARVQAERQMFSAMERAQKVNPEGNVIVTFHSSAALPDVVPDKGEASREGYVFNTDTGSVGRIPIKKHSFPGESFPKDTNVLNEEIKKINELQWAEKLRGISYYAQISGQKIESLAAVKHATESEIDRNLPIEKKQEEFLAEYNYLKGILNSSYVDMKRTFDLAHERANPNDKKMIDDFYINITNEVNEINKLSDDRAIEKSQKIKGIIDEGLKILEKVSPPEIYKNLNDFAKEKAVETFSNVAFKSYKDFKDKSPIISIENPPVGGAFGRGEELKEIVEKSREKFVEKAIQEGISPSEAKAQAEKLIGVTWDVGHINMVRKYDYDEKDVIKETEKVAPLVKHIHLSDNFGLDHTELPMGMGNVPMGEIMKKLGQKGFEAKKVIEAGDWWQHFKTSPVQETLEAFGSPVYSMKMQPYWNQATGFQQGYFSGYGQFLPQMNYETTGAGFSQLPAELGGSRGGGTAGSRMSGRPME